MGDAKLSKNINADEAPVMGAAFRAASLSGFFRVKEFVVRELNLFPLQARYESAQVSSKRPVTIYERNAQSATPKFLTIKEVPEELDVFVDYGESAETSNK